MALTSEQWKTVSSAGGSADAYRSMYEKQNTEKAAQEAATQKAASDASVLQQQNARAQQSLKAMQQTVGPNGQTSTIYGTPAGAARSGPSSSSSSSSSGSDGISEYELNQIKKITGAGQQPPVSRANIAGEQAARDAAFARAKEQSGRIAASSLEGLRNSLSRRGISGGGYAQMKGAEALGPAADQLQDFTREQMIQDLGQARHVADTEYSGQIAQRGQDQGSINALLNIINSRGKLY